MNNLIKINYQAEQPGVSARELHDGLEIKSNFTTWFERMTEYGFTEADYKKCFPNLESGCNGGQNLVDYDITVDMAKQICMIQRSEKGKQYREYFVDLEKAWNTPEQIFARALHMADKMVNSLKDRCKLLGGQVVEQQMIIEELQPKASYYDLILQCKDLISTTVIAKDYGISAKKLNSMLHLKGIQFKQGDTWVLYTKYQGNGYLKAKTVNYADTKGVQHSKEHSYWTQKGRLFLYELLKKEGYLPLIEKEIKEGNLCQS